MRPTICGLQPWVFGQREYLPSCTVAVPQAGHLAGAALDVMADEPPRPDHPLIALDNVLVTPHAAWLSEESLRQRSVLSAEAVIAALEGGMPPHTVNGEDGFPWLEA